MATTLDLPDDLRAARRDRVVRRACFAVLAVIVGLALLGVLGVKTSTATARGADGRTVTVAYPRVARGGLAVRFDVTITSPGGFDGPVEVDVNANYLAMFDENGLDPDPESAVADGDSVAWTFEPPDEGDTMVVSLDARVEPAVHWGRDGRTVVEFADGETIAVDYHTWIMP